MHNLVHNVICLDTGTLIELACCACICILTACLLVFDPRMQLHAQTVHVQPDSGPADWYSSCV